MNDRDPIPKRGGEFSGEMPGDEMNQSTISGEMPGDQTSDQMPGDWMNRTINKPATTGRLLVLFEEGATEAGAKLLQDAGGLGVSMADGTAGGTANQNLGNSGAVVYANLGVAVIEADSDQVNSINSASSEAGSPILTMELEQIVDVEPLPGIQQESQAATWGLVETNVIQSPYSGRGIKVAILDTGLDLNHPDFVGRTIISKSFVDGEEVQDLHGHGTHCTGTACGSREPKNTGTRYGIAYEAEIYIGKVLNNKGSGMDNSILDGINWALSQGCQIISMSIGGLVSVGASYSPIYESVASRVLKQGTLIVVAAGNDSLRNRTSGPIINPVSRPANCPSMMAVAAIDRNFNIASFSNGAINSDGGEVNIAAPGVDVFSSWPQSRNYNTINGTSMATPHVAGIAALFAQADSNARGRKLWDRLMKNARSLNPLTERDVGAGLVQAPQ